MAGMDENGLVIKTQAEMIDEISAEQVEAISDELDVSATSALGQINASHMRQVALVWELCQEAYEGGTVRASGAQLTDVCELTGTLRNPATYSQVLANPTLAAGTYAAGALIAHPTGDPTARFENVNEIVAPGGLVTGELFRATETGPVRANAGTLTVIAEAVSGWTAITNPLDATLGALIESDTALRIRRENELARTGSATARAVRVDVLDVEGVTYCTVIENDTDAVVSGQPAHSLQCVVLGGDDTDIAEAIYASKAGGIQAYGTTTETITNSEGTEQDIGFTRPTSVTVWIDIDFSADSDTWLGDANACILAMKEALVDFGDTLSIGDDVIRSRLIAVAIGVVGILDVTVLEIGVTDGGEVSSNLTIAATALADFDTSRIDTNITLV